MPRLRERVLDLATLPRLVSILRDRTCSFEAEQRVPLQ